MEFLSGVTSHNIKTDRLTVHYLEFGPQDGIPVLLIHGNLSTGRFYEHLMPMAPAGYRFIMPDMRGFGETERLVFDATGGLKVWAEDARSLVQALAITQPVHLAGWSTGGAAIAEYAIANPNEVASLTFIDPVSPYGFGGCHLDGTPCYADWAGTGGGTGNPEFNQRITDGDRSSDSPLSPRNVISTSYWSANYKAPAALLDMLVDEVLKTDMAGNAVPGDLTASENWPGVAPGTIGVLNALSGKYCNWSGIVDIDPKPPVLWVHGTEDIVVADNSAWEMGTLGSMGLVPGWPGADVFPPQQMVTQLRNTFEAYAANGATAQMEMFEGSGHGPLFDAADRFADIFFSFLQK